MPAPAIATPKDYGLPDKFDHWRSGQEEGLRLLSTTTTRHIDLCAPTGFGKSPLVVADAINSGEPTAIVTASRGLQDQYMDDFKSCGMVDLRGRNNYTCEMKEGYTCEDGYAANCQYKGTIACQSSQAEMRAATSSLVVTNYSKWTSNRMFGQGLSHIKRVVFDEAHNAPGAIAAAMQVTLHSKEVEDGLGIPFLGGSDAEDMREWKAWATIAKAVVDAAVVAAKARITGVNDPKPAWVRHFTHMRNLARKMAIIATARPLDWIVEQVEKGYQFDPIHPGRYGEACLFLQVTKVIMVSATLRPKTMFMCGVGKDNFTFKEFASDFDKARCPIYYVPTMRVDSRSGDLGLLWAMLDRVASKRREHKGIIHTVSYARQEEIAQRSRFFESMVVNPKGSPATETVELFKNSPMGTILVSPSVGEGYDFPDDQCRWQVMCKIPFEPPSRIVKAREAADPEYRAYQAVQQLVQAFGRGMRSRTDWCESFIGDEHLEWFLPRYGHLAPRSFHGFYKRTTVLPQPLRFAA